MPTVLQQTFTRRKVTMRKQILPAIPRNAACYRNPDAAAHNPGAYGYCLACHVDVNKLDNSEKQKVVSLDERIRFRREQEAQYWRSKGMPEYAKAALAGRRVA